MSLGSGAQAKPSACKVGVRPGWRGIKAHAEALGRTARAGVFAVDRPPEVLRLGGLREAVVEAHKTRLGRDPDAATSMGRDLAGAVGRCSHGRGGRLHGSRDQRRKIQARRPVYSGKAYGPWRSRSPPR